jgi:WD40 repeat protein/uncharacterized protein YegL
MNNTHLMQIRSILLLCTVLACVSGPALRAQSLTLFDIDASAHPTMQAKFYALDAQRNRQRPLATELAITENGVQQTITNVTCPPEPPPRALSSVLVVDVSGSMNGRINNTSKINLARSAARSWVNGLPSGNSECALVSFDGANYLNQDFTTDRTRLLAAIDKLNPQGGTDYDKALIERIAGGLLVSKNGKHQRLIVLVTDGHAPDPNISAIIGEANRQSCIIFFITLGLPAPLSLRDIAAQTGGHVFENVTTVEQAELVYRMIMATAQNTTPCSIEWQSASRCKAGAIKLNVTWQGQSATGWYTTSTEAEAKLEFSPASIRFDHPLIGMPVTQTISVTANNAAFTVTNITTTNPAYTLTPTSFTLQANESRTLTLTYTAADSGFTSARFTLENSVCPQSFFASSGYPGKKPKTPTLKLTHPNGGETFVVGSDTTITWEGIPPTELVNLHYSINNGTSWRRIDTARGDSYRWANIPGPASDLCRVRVQQLPKDFADSQPSWLVIHSRKQSTGWITAVSFSPDAAVLASGNYDGSIVLWDAVTLQEIRTLNGHTAEVTRVTFSPDGNILASSGCDNRVRLWDIQSGQEIDLPGNVGLSCYSSASFSPSSTLLASGHEGGVITLWNLATGQKNPLERIHTNGITSLAFSPDGSMLASASEDGKVILWNPSSGNVLRELNGHNGAVLCVAFNPDGTTLASGGLDNKVVLWDVQSGSRLRSLLGHTDWVKSIAFNHDGSLLASACLDNSIKLWDPSTGLEVSTLNSHSDWVMDVSFSPNADVLASGSKDGSIKLWSVKDVSIQDDQSDGVFSIVKPLAAASDVDLGQCLVGSAKDSVVVDLVRNVGTYPFEVRSISFTGPDAAAFALVSGIPTYRVDAGNTHDGEFRFEPSRVGLHQAQVVIVTQSDTLVQTIRGTGVAPLLAIVNTIVDFGRIPITTSKDTLRVATVRNVGNAPLDITQVRHAGPNDADFTTITGGGSFVLQPGDTHLMDLRFTANNVGRTSGALEFSYNGVGSPAVVQLFAWAADTVRTTSALPNISVRAGQALEIPLVMVDHTSLDMPAAPRRFVATMALNPTVVHVTDPSNMCTSIDAYRCEYTLTGTRGTGDTLMLIPAVATLGVTDFAPLELTSFQWLDAGDTVIITTLDGSIRITDICDEGGARLYLPGNTGYSLASRPNPAQSVAELQFGLAGAGPVVIDVIDQTGRTVLTPVSEAILPAGLHMRNVDVSTLSNGPYILLLRSGNTTLTSRLDVVR